VMKEQRKGFREWDGRPDASPVRVVRTEARSLGELRKLAQRREHPPL